MERSDFDRLTADLNHVAALLAEAASARADEHTAALAIRDLAAYASRVRPFVSELDTNTLASYMIGLLNQLPILPAAPSAGDMHPRLAPDHAAWLDRAARAAISAFAEELADRAEVARHSQGLDDPAREEVDDIAFNVSRLVSIWSARAAAREAVEAVEAVRESAGDVGAHSLAAEFGRYASSEGFAAELFRAVAVAVVVLTALLAYLQARDGDLDTAGEVAKLAWTIPLAGLATYLARESNHHRAAARWSRILTVQLQSIGPYCASLNDDAAVDKLRAELGARAFLSGVPKSAKDDESTPAPTGEALALLEALLARAGAQAPDEARAGTAGAGAAKD